MVYWVVQCIGTDDGLKMVPIVGIEDLANETSFVYAWREAGRFKKMWPEKVFAVSSFDHFEGPIRDLEPEEVE